MTAAAVTDRRARDTDTGKQTKGADEKRKTTSINLRVPERTRELIDTAAAVVGKSRTEFMLESARQHAIDVLLDRRIFVLDKEQFKAFNAILTNPPRANLQLKKLFASKSPWERSNP